jgi:hypothetical protein
MPDLHLAWGAPGSETYLVHKQCNLCGNWWQSKCTYHLNVHTNPHIFYYYALKMQRVQCTCYVLSLWSMCLAFLMSLQLQFLWSHVDLGFCTFIQYLTFSNVSSSPTDHKLCCGDRAGDWRVPQEMASLETELWCLLGVSSFAINRCLVVVFKLCCYLLPLL